ncbi:hypothetical protein [Arthrobacter methylotrophus]|uniref:hypothetical protein n=1 Tax=Arthrobacter methylotrophus TaxID=121291 RepID=UPI0031EE6E2C
MALSSTAANADSGDSNHHSLLGGAGSAVTNVVHDATAPTPAVVAHPLPRLTRAIDQGVASTPVVNGVVPEGMLATVPAPVVSTTTGAVDGVGTGFGTVASRVVSPVLGTVGSTAGALPVSIPGIAVGLPTAQLDATLPGPSAALAPTTHASSPLAEDVAAPAVSPADPFDPPGVGISPWNTMVWATASEDPSVPPSGGTPSADAPSGAVAGGAAAALTSNPSGTTAGWLPGINLLPPFAGILISATTAGRTPAPVSFDPGSSPD